MPHDDTPPQTPTPPPHGPASPAPDPRLLEALGHLFQKLAPFMAPLPQEDFQGLVGGGLAQALGEVPPPPAPADAPPAAAPPAPRDLNPVPPAPGIAVAGGGFEAPLGPPPLPPAEQVLEERLAQSAHAQYEGDAWWERTMFLMATWNQMRRRLGHLSPQFPRLGSHWQQPDWPDFNLARRQADGQGIDYEQWVAAQFQRPGRQDQCQAPLPQELHGPEAQEAWRAYQESCRLQAPRPDPDAPPYPPGGFDLYNPRHVDFAQRLINEIMGLAAHVHGPDPQGPARLLALALRRGTLPPAALELVPQLKQRVLDLAALADDAG